jgi:hypothetical protein
MSYWWEPGTPVTSTPERRAKRARYKANVRRKATTDSGMIDSVSRLIDGNRHVTSTTVAAMIHQVYLDRGFRTEGAGGAS